MTPAGDEEDRLATPDWRASVASETLTGVKMKKIGDVCWRASDSIGVDNARGTFFC